MPPPPSHLSVSTRSWQVASYGDLSEFAGIGGGAWHFRFRNSTGQAEDFLAIGGGIGLQVQIPAGLLTRLGALALGAFNNFISRAANAAISSYVPANARRSLCFNDLAGARAMMSCAQAGIGIGGALSGLNVLVHWQDAHPSLEVDLSGFSYTLGAGAFAAGAVLLPVGSSYVDASMRQRYEQERHRHPGAPAIRDPGHY